MTKKDYKLIALAINRVNRNHAGVLPTRALIGELSQELARDNSRFDRTRFENACLLNIVKG